MRPSQAGTSTIQRRNPEGVKADILRIATAEFIENGFSGTRVDEIAARTHTTKRMIYYYFESKEALFTSVMDFTFEQFWSRESLTDVSGLDPVSALRWFAEERFDAYASNAGFVRLLAVENTRAADHFATRFTRRPASEKRHDLVAEILARGVAEGLFRADIDAIDLRMLIVSFSSFRSVFRSTVSTVYGRDMLDETRMAFYRKLAGDMVVATLTTFPAAAPDDELMSSSPRM